MKRTIAKYTEVFARLISPRRLHRVLLLWAAVAFLTGMSACSNQDEEPHPAILYNICDVAQATDESSVFYLYRPDADKPIVLSAPRFSPIDSKGELPAAGTSGFLAYYPSNNEPYKDSEITVNDWVPIYNFDITIPDEDEETPTPADTEAVQYLAGWRGGEKLYLRLRLPYSTLPRRFGLVADPATLDSPLPSIYLLNERSETAPTFDRQYYFAFEIAPVWNLTSVEGIRLIVNDNLSGGIREFIFYKNL